jgi:Leucine-rich repeat (LRR) protein
MAQVGEQAGLITDCVTQTENLTETDTLTSNDVKHIMYVSTHHSGQSLAIDRFWLKLHNVPSTKGVAQALFATDTEYIMPLPSAALRPLQLCQRLEVLSVCGPAITDLDFVANLPALAELSVDASQVRDLGPLATLPSLRKLVLTNLNLEGGGEIDLSPLQRITTLEEACFSGSSAVANVAPLAKVATLRSLDVTNCARVTDRRAFTANPHIVITPA